MCRSFFFFCCSSKRWRGKTLSLSFRDVYEIDFKLHFNPSICIRFSSPRKLPSPFVVFIIIILDDKALAAVKFSNLFYFPSDIFILLLGGRNSWTFEWGKMETTTRSAVAWVRSNKILHFSRATRGKGTSNKKYFTIFRHKVRNFIA